MLIEQVEKFPKMSNEYSDKLIDFKYKKDEQYLSSL